MIKTQQMEHGGMQVMDGNGVFGCLETKVIGGSVGRAPADPSPCHPKREPPMIVIPPLGGPSPTLIHFDRRGSTKLARAENERFIQQSPLFEVDDQGRQALITLIGYLAMGILDVGMAVPWLKIPMPCLNKAYPLARPVVGRSEVVDSEGLPHRA